MQLENFARIKANYENLEQDNFNFAYQLMKEASSEQVYLETEKAAADREVARLKAKAEMAEATEFLEFAKTNAIGKSEKLAEIHPAVYKAWDEYYEAEKAVSKLKSLIGFLNRVYFDAKMVYEYGNKAYRQNKQEG